MTSLEWLKIPISEGEICLKKVLRCGQAFRWQNHAGVWSCAFSGKVFFLKQNEKFIEYSTLAKSGQKNDADESLNFLKDYLNLSVDLSSLYSEWCKKDANFAKHSTEFVGIRILRQDPWENLVSFICSTNNNVKRISQMCQNLCTHFGEYVATYNGIKYYDFPEPQKLAHASVEQALRDLGFGYRAKYIQKTAAMVSLDGKESLFAIRQMPYKEAHGALTRYIGVGPKVADCVCLMSMDKNEVVPVDTHVLQIVQRDYKFKQGKQLNPKLYEEIQVFFKDLWGEYAGWAHSVLFAADLSDLNNGVNVSAQSGPGKAVKVETVKKVTVSAVESGRISKVQHIKKELVDDVVYSRSGRPLRGKRKLEQIQKMKIVAH